MRNEKLQLFVSFRFHSAVFAMRVQRFAKTARDGPEATASGPSRYFAAMNFRKFRREKVRTTVPRIITTESELITGETPKRIIE